MTSQNKRSRAEIENNSEREKRRRESTPELGHIDMHGEDSDEFSIDNSYEKVKTIALIEEGFDWSEALYVPQAEYF